MCGEEKDAVEALWQSAFENNPWDAIGAWHELKTRLARLRPTRLGSDQGEGGATPVERGHLFRVASISKPIRAVAVMRLVEQGRLRLTDRVFGAGALLGTTLVQEPYLIEQTGTVQCGERSERHRGGPHPLDRFSLRLRWNPGS